MMFRSQKNICQMSCNNMLLTMNRRQSNRILPIKEFIREVKSRHQYEKIGCLDFGMKCIGVASTDETKQYSFPSGSISVKQPPKTNESLIDLHRQLQLFCTQERIRYFVVGFPMMPGAAKAITPLGNHIVWSIQGMPTDGIPLTFCMWDEEYSTSDARQSIKHASGKRNMVLRHKDAVAASIILKSFLGAFRY